MCEAAIVIESNALITIVVAMASTILSAGATWYFSKRRYAATTGPITDNDLELEKLRIQSRPDLLGFIIILTFVGGLLAFLLLSTLPLFRG